MGEHRPPNRSARRSPRLAPAFLCRSSRAKSVDSLSGAIVGRTSVRRVIVGGLLSPALPMNAWVPGGGLPAPAFPGTAAADKLPLAPVRDIQAD